MSFGVFLDVTLATHPVGPLLGTEHSSPGDQVALSSSAKLCAVIVSGVAYASGVRLPASAVCPSLCSLSAFQLASRRMASDSGVRGCGVKTVST